MSNDTSFEIGLEPTGDRGSAFKFRNETPDQIQRPKVVDSIATLRSDNRVQGYLKTVIHGRFDGPGSQAATLIVAHFRFLSSSDSRKFRSADVTFVFKDPEPTVYAPEVNSVAPDGQIDLYPGTIQFSSVGKKGAQIGGAVAGFTVSGNVEMEESVSHDLGSKGALIGSHFTVNRSWGPANAARWAMSENKVQKSGIPSELRVAILLKRRDDLPFVAELKVTATVDWLYEANMGIRKIRGLDIIDPINFDPTTAAIGLDALPPGITVNDLSKVVLADLCQIEPINPKGADTS